ncbi:hypothetical protein J580_0932 [Acinetobacter sp. 1542444]|nr:hypothetical protein J580_0932 [Acinetobacter sp. 1542444]
MLETKQMSREQWLQIRKQRIGISDAATTNEGSILKRAICED